MYAHEVERKCARFAESVIASTARAAEIKTGLRYWSAMVAHYAIEVTDKATVKAYKDCGVKRVMWLTVPTREDAVGVLSGMERSMILTNCRLNRI